MITWVEPYIANYEFSYEAEENISGQVTRSTTRLNSTTEGTTRNIPSLSTQETEGATATERGTTYFESFIQNDIYVQVIENASSRVTYSFGYFTRSRTNYFTSAIGRTYEYYEDSDDGARIQTSSSSGTGRNGSSSFTDSASFETEFVEYFSSYWPKTTIDTFEYTFFKTELLKAFDFVPTTMFDGIKITTWESEIETTEIGLLYNKRSTIVTTRKTTTQTDYTDYGNAAISFFSADDFAEGGGEVIFSPDEFILYTDWNKEPQTLKTTFETKLNPNVKTIDYVIVERDTDDPEGSILTPLQFFSNPEINVEISWVTTQTTLNNQKTFAFIETLPNSTGINFFNYDVTTLTTKTIFSEPEYTFENYGNTIDSYRTFLTLNKATKYHSPDISYHTTYLAITTAPYTVGHGFSFDSYAYGNITATQILDPDYFTRGGGGQTGNVNVAFGITFNAGAVTNIDSAIDGGRVGGGNGTYQDDNWARVFFNTTPFGPQQPYWFVVKSKGVRFADNPSDTGLDGGFFAMMNKDLSLVKLASVNRTGTLIKNAGMFQTRNLGFLGKQVVVFPATNESYTANEDQITINKNGSKFITPIIIRGETSTDVFDFRENLMNGIPRNDETFIQGGFIGMYRNDSSVFSYISNDTLITNARYSKYSYMSPVPFLSPNYPIEQQVVTTSNRNITYVPEFITGTLARVDVEEFAEE